MRSLADHRGMEGRAAAAQDDSLDLAQFGVGHFQAAELGSCFFDGEPSAQGVANRVRLLEDLLEHVMGKSPLSTSSAWNSTLLTWKLASEPARVEISNPSALRVTIS